MLIVFDLNEDCFLSLLNEAFIIYHISTYLTNVLVVIANLLSSPVKRCTDPEKYVLLCTKKEFTISVS